MFANRPVKWKIIKDIEALAAEITQNTNAMSTNLLDLRIIACSFLNDNGHWAGPHWGRQEACFMADWLHPLVGQFLTRCLLCADPPFPKLHNMQGSVNLIA
jgi:hypothetical protein